MNRHKLDSNTSDLKTLVRDLLNVDPSAFAQLGAKSGAGGNVQAGLHEFMRDMLERSIGMLWAPDHHEVRLQTEAGARALGYDARLYNLQQLCSLALVRMPRRKRGLKDLSLHEARANVVDFPRKPGARGQRSSVAELVAVALVLLEPDFDALRDAPGLDASSISVRVAMDDLLNVKPEALIRPYYDEQSDIEVASQRDPEAMALAGLSTMLTRIVFHVPLILEQGIDSIRFLLMTEANYADAGGAAAANLAALLTLGLLADGKRDVAFVAQQH